MIGRDINVPEFKQVASARSLAVETSIDKFMYAANSYIEVSPRLDVSLIKPTIYNESADNFELQKPDGVPIDLSQFPERLPAPSMTLTKLSDVVCGPRGVAVSPSGVILEESFFSHWDIVTHHSIDFLPGLGHKLKDDFADIRHLKGSYLYLDDQHIRHYGHFIVDVLSRAWSYSYIREYLGFTNFKVLITKSHEQYIFDLLLALGISQENIIQIETAVRVDELLIPSKSYQIQEYASPLAQNVWGQISSYYFDPSSCPRKIYLSRAKMSQRVMTNETAIHNVFIARGFEIIHPQEHSIADQIKMVASAELIAGSSGSNMFTLAFQKKMRSSYIISSPKLIHLTDVLFQAGKNPSMYLYIGTEQKDHPHYNPEDLHSPWMVADGHAINNDVDKWLEEVGG